MRIVAGTARRVGRVGLVVLLVAGCTSGDARDTPAAESGTSEASSARPLPTISVAATPTDVSATATAVPGEATMLDLTGPDGVAYHLELPPGAVEFPVDITMTALELAEADGGPAGAGVELEPTGLWLLEPGRLTITGGPEGDDVAPFVYEDPSAATLATLDPAKPSSIMVFHFSGFGLLLSWPLAWSEPAEPSPTGELDARADALRDRLNQGIRDWLDHKMSDAEAEVLGERLARDRQALLEDYAALALDLARNGTLDDLVTIRDILGRLFAVAKMLEILASDEPLPDLEVLSALRQNMLERCVRDHDLEGLLTILSIERQLGLVGADGEGDDAGSADPTADLSRRCARVDVHWRVAMEWRGDLGEVTYRFGAIVTTSIGPQRGAGAAAAPYEVQWTEDLSAWEECQWTLESVAPGTFETLDRIVFDVAPAPKEPFDARRWTPEGVTVTYSIGSPDVTTKLVQGPCAPSRMTFPMITEGYRAAYESVLRGDNYVWSSGWEMVRDGAVLARQTREGSAGDAESAVEVTTTIELVHNPV